MTDLILKLNISIREQVNIQFRIENTFLIRTVYIETSIDKIQFHVIQADTLFLLCLADIDELQVYYNNLKNILITYTRKVSVARQFSYLFLLWNSSLQVYLLESFDLNLCYLTDVELQYLH
jgi:hypothetical protein